MIYPTETGNSAIIPPKKGRRGCSHRLFRVRGSEGKPMGDRKKEEEGEGGEGEGEVEGEEEEEQQTLRS